MKLSIIVLCWNDLKVLPDCLRSIFETTRATEFEVIVSDNGSTDGSIDFVRTNYPQARLIENGRNLRFAKANNVGIRASRGEYVLILNPDTIIREGALDEMVRFADRHPEAGTFGCRVLNVDGSYQESARPFQSIGGEWITALGLRSLGYLSRAFDADTYVGWKGNTERTVDWVSGCFILARRDLLNRIDGFDEQFFYYFEDMDLCRRIRQTGCSILFYHGATIVHLGGQSTSKRFPPLTFVLDGQITRYLYFFKYGGVTAVRRCRQISLVSNAVRFAAYRVLQMVKPDDHSRQRLEMLRVLLEWHYKVDPVRLVENGEEPDLGVRAVGRVLER
jgi:GT2 family glycosyltransferase